MRYQVFAVANEHYNSVGARLSYFDNLEGAKYFAANSSSVARLSFGTAILDHSTGKYDFGFGFGVAVPELHCSKRRSESTVKHEPFLSLR
jgi:hypothetical protein